MSAQEYELAFVTALPRNVRVVEPDTLDFANPAGALAFRYKHGWILVNPLIPSRGRSGGGLARQHGHISGGHTTGHFIKGADGKMQFKAVNRYASKEDWIKEVKGSAAQVAAKQEAVHKAVDKAESASHAAQKLEGSSAPKAAQAAAHKVAADAHLKAAAAFQAAGEGPAHQGGAMVHNAHGAIHGAKASKLEQAAAEEAKAAKIEARKAEAAKKLEAAKATAKGHSEVANAASAKAQKYGGLPSEKVKLHQEAVAAHKQAQISNKEAGNHYVSDAHGQAVAKHEKIAANQQAVHDNLTTGAQKQSDMAKTATGNADASVNESLASQIAAHKVAADSHAQAANLHDSVGNAEKAKFHKGMQTTHGMKAEHLSEKKAEQDALDAAHKDAAKAADEASAKARGAEETLEGIAAHKAAMKAHIDAEKAAKAAGKLDTAQDHHDNAVAHMSQAGKTKKKLNQLGVESDAASTKAGEFSKQAHQANSIAAHSAAKDAHLDAAEAAKKAGFPNVASYHEKKAGEHDQSVQELHAAKVEDQKKQAKLNQAAAEASARASQMSVEANKAHTPEAHEKAMEAHAQAFVAAKDAGDASLKDHHKNKAKTHAAKIKELEQEQAQVAKNSEVTQHVVTALGHAKAAEDAGVSKDAVEKHLDAATSYVDAAAAAHKAGMPGDSEAFKDKAKEHVKKANEIGAQVKANKATTDKAAAVQAPPAQVGVTSGAKKPVGNLTGTGKQLGSHSNEVMVDEAGNEWLKKNDDYSRLLDPAVASLQRKVGMRTPVFVKTKDGHLQKMLPGSKDAFPNGQFDPEKLSEKDIATMLQHQVLDWATGNQDSHSGQWLRTKSGDLVQIDQAQAFKHGVGKNDPTYTYPPLGLDTPVYSKLWQAAKDGKIQIPDPNGDNDFAKTIKAIQELPDDQFKALFTPYAHEVLKNGSNPGGHATTEAFLDDIVKHKNSIGKDFEKLYSQLPESTKAPAQAPALSKEDALKNVADQVAKGTLINSGAISKAKEAGATLQEIHAIVQKAAKDTALKKLAEHEAAGGDIAEGGKLEQLALTAGASVEEVKQVGTNPKKYLKSLAGGGSPSAGAVSKEEALAKVADYAANPPANWSTKDFVALKQAATDAGASPDELKEATHTPEKILEKAAKAPSAPAASAPATPAPKAKWTKVGHSVKVGGAPQDVQGVQGPKGLVVHKTVNGSGWSVSQQGGMNVGGKKFKTQKEAKLAAEWMAQNYHGSSFSEEDFKKWKNEQPDAFAAYKKGVVGEHWNNAPAASTAPSTPAATPTAAPAAPAGKAKMPSTPAGATGWKKVSHPATGNAAYVHPESGIHISKKPYGTMWQLSTPDGAVIGVQYSLKDAKAAAGQLTTPYKTGYSPSHDKIKLKQIASAFGKDSQAYKDAEKIYAEKHGSVPEIHAAEAPKPYTPGSTQEATVKKQPPNPHTDSYQTSGSQSKDTHNLKAILAANGSTSPKFLNAKAEWEKKYGKKFDPNYKNPYATKVTPPPYSDWQPSNMKSFTDQDSTDRATLKKVTKQHWSQDTVDQGFIAPSITQSLHGDWKPDHDDIGPGSGPMIYSGGSYDAINDQLRGNALTGLMPIGPKGGDWDDVVAHADKLFDEVPPLTQNIVLSRKVGSDGGAFPKSPPPMTPGAVFTDHGYVSTSKSRDIWSGPVQMEVRVPKGMKVLDLNHTTGSNHSSELEVLLPRGTRYRVISDGPGTDYGQNRHIVVEMLPPLPGDSAIAVE